VISLVHWHQHIEATIGAKHGGSVSKTLFLELFVLVEYDLLMSVQMSEVFNRAEVKDWKHDQINSQIGKIGSIEFYHRTSLLLDRVKAK